MKFAMKVALPADSTTATKIKPIMMAMIVQYFTMAPESLVLPATMTPVMMITMAAITKVGVLVWR